MTEDPSSRSDEELYRVVRHAVEDALWHVVGTAVYTLFLVGILAVGLQVALTGLFTTTDYGIGLSVFGAVVAVAAGLELARTFEVFPFSR